MLRRLVLIGLCVAVLGAATAWVLSAPSTLSDDQFAAFPQQGDAAAGQLVFWAGGCASCHAAPKAADDAKLVLTGGHEFDTPFGTFIAPNISPHPVAGIGDWNLREFANAMKHGVRPDGAHYYPAFPYPSYSRMTDKDVADLWAFMGTLPEVAEKAPDHRVGFPFNIRRSLGFWKLLYFKPEFVINVPAQDAVLQRGRYLVEALAHCGACHTPRDPLGGPNNAEWLAGGVTPDGKGKIPNISPHGEGIGDWSIQDIVYSLETGFTPEFDSFGSTMADVQINMTKLPASDRAAIAAYLKAIPAVATPK